MTQDDVLIGSLTVLECMMFVARLRLPSHLSTADKQAKVHQVLSEMGLLGCKDTFIGTWPAKGISGKMSNSMHASGLRKSNDSVLVKAPPHAQHTNNSQMLSAPGQQF